MISLHAVRVGGLGTVAAPFALGSNADGALKMMPAQAASASQAAWHRGSVLCSE